jgi:SPP1 gp7 family putative phage head morphogenesis protein
MTPDSPSIIAAMKMPPEEAVAFLQAKGLQVSESWRDIWQSAHTRAFTVARSAGFDVLGDIKEALITALNEGQIAQQFIDSLTPTLQARGWWGKAIDPATGEITKQYGDSGRPVELGSPRRLKLIYEQNLQTAFMAGRYKSFMAATDTHPFWQYVAVLDNRTRPAHRAMHGRVFRYDDPVWSVAYPPCGWRCRCRVRPLSNYTLQNEGRAVETASGHISEIEVPQASGSVIKVKRISLPGMSKPFQPDAGWDYNPADINAVR